MTNLKHILLVISSLLNYWLHYNKEQAKIIADIANSYNNSSDSYTIVFSGPPGQGKSTAINQLVRRRILPTGAVGATTGVATIIHHAEDCRADIFHWDDTTETITIKEPTPEKLQPYINADMVKEIHVYVPFNFLPQELRTKIRLVDVPGAFSIENERHTQIAVDMMAEAHLIYLFMDYSRPTLSDLNVFKTFIAQRKHDNNILAKTFFLFNKIDKFYEDDPQAFISGKVKTDQTTALTQECVELLGAKASNMDAHILYISADLSQITNILETLGIENKSQLEDYCDQNNNNPYIIAQLEKIYPYLRTIESSGTPNSVKRLNELSRFDFFAKNMVAYLQKIDFNKAVFTDLLNRCQTLHGDIGIQLRSERSELIQAAIKQNNDQIASLKNTVNAADSKVKELSQKITNIMLGTKLELSKQITKATDGLYSMPTSMLSSLNKITPKISTDKEENRRYTQHIINSTRSCYDPICSKVTEVNKELNIATEAIVSDASKSLRVLEQSLLLDEQLLHSDNRASINVSLYRFTGDNSFVSIPNNSQLYTEILKTYYPPPFNNDYKISPNTANLVARLNADVQKYLGFKVYSYRQSFEAALAKIEKHLFDLLNNGTNAYKQQQLGKIGVLEKNNKTLLNGLKSATIDVSHFSDELQDNAYRLQEYGKHTNDLNTISNAL